MARGRWDWSQAAVADLVGAAMAKNHRPHNPFAPAAGKSAGQRAAESREGFMVAKEAMRVVAAEWRRRNPGKDPEG